MLPVLMFASGLVAGVVGVRLLKKATTPAAPDLHRLGQRTRDGLRDATVTGLTAIETQAASLRAKLTPATEAAPTEPAADGPEQAATPDTAPALTAAAPEPGAEPAAPMEPGK